MQRDITGSAEGSHHMVQYRGTLDAFRKIAKYEGVRALYKGFGVATLGMVAGQIYITSYEVIRMNLSRANQHLKLVGEGQVDLVRNAVAGGTASLISGMIVVPVDIVSQKRMMMTGLSYGAQGDSKTPTVAAMIRNILKTDGPRGFYKGFGASLAVNAPSSAIWWGSYGLFRERLLHAAADYNGPMRPPDRVLEPLAGASAGVVSTIVTNPMDVARTRLQVDGRIHDGSTLWSTLRLLVKEEGAMSLMKGVGARLMASVPSSIMVIGVYELVKRLSRKTPPGGV